MRKRTFSSKLVLLLGTAAILGFSACTDNDYDFNEIDSTIGIGGDVSRYLRCQQRLSR